MGTRGNRKASISFIFFTLAVDAIGLGIILPVLPDVVRKFITHESSVDYIYGYFIATYALLQFVSSPILGRLSDRFGRRPILLISMFGGAIDYIFMAFAPTLPLLFVGRIISGISGASFTVASAYIADISDDSNRSKHFGVMGAGFGVGFILGPAIGGLLASRGTMYPFIAAALFNLLNFLFGLFVLPESLPQTLRRKFDYKTINPLRSLSILLKEPLIRGLVLAYVFITMAGQTHFSMWTLYTEYRFGWTPTQVGISLAVVGLLSAISQGALTGPLVKKFGELNLVTYGCLGEMVCSALYGFAASGTMFYIILLASSAFWASHPSLQSLISRKIPPNEQGELQGALMSLASLIAILNPVVMTSLFAATSNPQGRIYLPGSPYFLASLCFFVAWITIFRWSKHHHLTPTSGQLEEINNNSQAS